MNNFEKIVLIIVFVILLIIIAVFLFNKLSFMNNFQKIVLVIAIIILLALLVFISISLKSKQMREWPPVIGDCPDYWVDTSGNGGNCVNVQNLGSCVSSTSGKPLTMDFSGSNFSGSSGLCNKYNFANNCNVTWDGITYGGKSGSPCDQL
jgi:hypothetical protein